jgi:hypothetical protein
LLPFKILLSEVRGEDRRSNEEKETASLYSDAIVSAAKFLRLNIQFEI